MDRQRTVHRGRGFERQELPRAGDLLLAIPCLFLAGWLLIAPSMLGFDPSDARTDAFLNEAAAAVMTGMLGITLMSAEGNRRRAASLTGASGGWLILAPFVIGYGEVLPEAAANDVLGGTTALLLGAAAWVLDEPSKDGEGKTIRR